MTDFFDIPAKIGDKILFIIQDEFCTGTVLKRPKNKGLSNREGIYVNIDGSHNTFIKNKNFIIINDIIKNHPQYFI